jgi:hypothetical protein
MNKYKRKIKGVELDVYDILHYYKVNNPAVQHAIKKLLCAGSRGHKTEEQDLKEALDSIKRALELIVVEYEEEQRGSYEPLHIGTDWEERN